VDAPFVEELLERLAPLGALRARRMFGGVGLYCDEVFFGLVADGVLYFRVDEESVGAFEAAGMEPFRPFEDKPPMKAYWEVPLEVQERPQRLAEWAREALAAARRRDAAKRRKASRKRPKADPGATPVRKLLNLGPRSAEWLEQVGIRTRADLERVGSVAAYRKVRDAGLESSLNLLWALEGALLEVRWDRLPPPVKEDLRLRAGLGDTRKRAGRGRRS
jgi:DNA transformation protein